MRNIAIKGLVVLIFATLLWTIIKLEEPPTFDQSCLFFIVMLVGLQIFKE